MISVSLRIEKTTAPVEVPKGKVQWQKQLIPAPGVAERPGRA
jgi:hypothetical protein